MLNFENTEIPEEVQKQLNEQVAGLVSSKVEEETTGMRSKLDELLSEAKTAKQKAKEAEEAKARAAEEAARTNGDIEAIDRSWQQKYEKLEAEKRESEERSNKIIRDKTTGQAATKLAAELGGPNANGLMPHITPRLDVDMSTGQVKVLDVNGQPSALTVEELRDELKNTEYLAPLIIASQASGASAGGSKSAGGASGKQMTADEKLAASINERIKNKVGR